MPRPRTATSVLQLAGTYRADRHADRVAEPAEHVGPAPNYLPPLARRIWREVVGQAPWLRACDRGTVEAYVRLAVEARTNFAGMSAARIAVWVGTGAKLGLNPRDRTHIGAGAAPADDDAGAEWFA